MRCCAEHGCRRTQPILIRFAPFARRWVAVTRYTERADHPGAVRASVKHDIHDDLVHELVAHGWTPPAGGDRAPV